MSTKLVRFIRSHEDDDDYVASRYGPYSGSEGYFGQLLDEFADGNFADRDKLTLVYSEMRIHGTDDVDKYALYVRFPSEPSETPKQLAERIQTAFDDGAIAGWFQIIE
jgi:hypothetical protein